MAPATRSARSPSRPTARRSPRSPAWRRSTASPSSPDFAERAGDAIYNSAVLVDAGRPAQRSTENASSTATTSARCSRPATRRRSSSTFGGLKFGMLICYDVEFPESVRAPGARGRRRSCSCRPRSRTRRTRLHRRKDRAGARLRERHRHRLCRPRRRRRALRLCRALVHRAPDGKHAAGAGLGSALIVADYDPANFAASRAANPYLRDLARSAGRLPRN